MANTNPDKPGKQPLKPLCACTCVCLKIQKLKELSEHKFKQWHI